jgi:hypothetical protein
MDGRYLRGQSELARECSRVLEPLRGTGLRKMRTSATWTIPASCSRWVCAPPMLSVATTRAADSGRVTFTKQGGTNKAAGLACAGGHTMNHSALREASRTIVRRVLEA